MSYVPYYKPSDWIAECYYCGCMFKGSELLKTWDGKYVCQEDYEVKHPQLTVRGVKDQIRVPFSSPEGEDTFVALTPNVTQPSFPFGDVENI